MGAGQYKVNNFNPLIKRCFDHVWRLNLIAINMKNTHRNKLIQFFTESRLHEFSPDSMFPDTKLPQTFPDSAFPDSTFPNSKFPDTARNRKDLLSDSSLRV